jgi:hypothetical protein
MNHQAMAHPMPAKRHPFQAPKPEHPRTAHVMPPKAPNSSVGRIRSCVELRRLALLIIPPILDIEPQEESRIACPSPWGR